MKMQISINILKIKRTEIKLFEFKDVKAIYLNIMHNEEENSKPEFMKRPGTNPFRTPDGYFDSIEDRIMKKIQLPEKKKSTSAGILRILKPVLGIAAMLALVFLLVNNPFTKNTVNTEASTALTPSVKDDSTFNFSSIDESTLVNAIFSNEKSTVADINPDEMLAYLSSGLNEVEIYSEIQN